MSYILLPEAGATLPAAFLSGILSNLFLKPPTPELWRLWGRLQSVPKLFQYYHIPPLWNDLGGSFIFLWCTRSDLPPALILGHCGLVTLGLLHGIVPGLSARGPAPNLLITTREFHCCYSPHQLPPHVCLHWHSLPHLQGAPALPKHLPGSAARVTFIWCKPSSGLDPHFIPMGGQRQKPGAPKTQAYGLKIPFTQEAQMLLYPQRACGSKDPPPKCRGTAEATTEVWL